MDLHVPKFHKKKSAGVIHPVRDWTLLVAIFIFLIALDIVGSLFLYRVQQTAVEEDVAADLPKVQTINEGKLQKVVDALSKKENQFNHLWESKPTYPSPR